MCGVVGELCKRAVIRLNRGLSRMARITQIL